MRTGGKMKLIDHLKEYAKRLNEDAATITIIDDTNASTTFGKEYTCEVLPDSSGEIAALLFTERESGFVQVINFASVALTEVRPTKKGDRIQ
jgi:hypothetical protein